MTDHTPGPWTACEVRRTRIFDLTGPDVTGRGRELIGIFRASQNRATDTANAALIAAAPELLKALKVLMDRATALPQPATHDGLLNADALALARATIAKAEGNTL